VIFENFDGLLKSPPKFPIFPGFVSFFRSLSV